MAPYVSHTHSRPGQRRLTARRILGIVALAGTLNLQGCANSAETFALGAVVGAAAGVTAVTCTVLCH